MKNMYYISEVRESDTRRTVGYVVKEALSQTLAHSSKLIFKTEDEARRYLEGMLSVM